MSGFKQFTKPLNGKETKFLVRSPNSEDYKEADKIRVREFNENLKIGYPLQEKMLSVMKEQGLWDDDNEKRMLDLRTEISNYEYKLKQRGFKKGKHGNPDPSTGYGICLKMREARGELFSLLNRMNMLRTETAEGKASQVFDNYLVYLCLVYEESNEKVFSSFEDYVGNTTKNESNLELFAVVLEANLCFQELVGGFNRDFNSLLPENAWLMNYGFTDKKGGLINEKGQRIDSMGRLIDEDGRYVNEEGLKVDASGRLLDEGGNFVIEPKPFLDDSGNPIVDEEFKVALASYKDKIKKLKEEAKKHSTKE